MIVKVTLASIAAITLVACASPQVKYSVFAQGSPRTDIGEPMDTYMLAKSIVSVERKKDEKGQYIFYIGLVRAEDTQRSFGIRPVDRFGVKTNLGIVKVNNTNLIQSVTVAIDDKRKEFIASAFKLLTTIAVASTGIPSSALGGAQPVTYPVEIDALKRLSEEDCQRGACEVSLLAPPKSDLSIRMSVGEVPPDAIAADRLVDLLKGSDGFLLAAACRRASVQVILPDKPQNSVTKFSLSDPRFVQVIPLPAKGVITFHNECGYSVTDDKVEIQPDLDVADSALQELLKLIDAIKKPGNETHHD